jgi:hypothetical protein
VGPPCRLEDQIWFLFYFFTFVRHYLQVSICLIINFGSIRENCMMDNACLLCAIGSNVMLNWLMISVVTLIFSP